MAENRSGIKLSEMVFKYRQGEFHLSVERMQIKPNNAAAIIGPSGCGKTTLMSLMAGILIPQSGSIHVNGIPVHTMSDLERRRFRIQNIGFIFQDFALLDYLTLYDNILFPFRINPVLELTSKVKMRAKHLADQLGITKRLASFPGQTSQGEQQRAAIARALLNEPSVILADEPTGNLDPHNKMAIMCILKDYIWNHEATLIVATHDYDLLESFEQVIDMSSVIGESSIKDKPSEQILEHSKSQ